MKTSFPTGRLPNIYFILFYFILVWEKSFLDYELVPTSALNNSFQISIFEYLTRQQMKT